MALLVGVTATAACNRGGDDDRARPGPTSTARPGVTTTIPDLDRPRGGSARVGMWGAPDPGAPTIAGAAVRALVLPQLFVALPDGTWRPSMVEPGSDRTGADGMSASFRFRKGAAWSDGSPIGVADLRRNPDGRFVKSIDDPRPDGTITVRFTQGLPGWRRLWSGADAIAAPKAGVWGGPFVVTGVNPALEVVLGRNPRWSGVVAKGPFLDELRLVLVPDAITAAQLLEKGQLDAIMPPAFTVRTRELRATAGVKVEVADRGGWWVGLFLSSRLSEGRRRALAGTVNRDRFVSVLLREEATVLNGFLGPEDGAWAGVKYPDPAALRGGDAVDLVGQIEEPMTGAIERVIQRRAQTVSGVVDLRNAEAERVEPWLAKGEYDALIGMTVDDPEPCWLCRWQSVDEGLARRADAGDRAAAAELQVKLRDQAHVLPLWRPRTVVAWREGLNGLRANGYARVAAWNAWEWWRE